MRAFGLPVKRLVLAPDEWRERDRVDTGPVPHASAVSGTYVDADWWVGAADAREPKPPDAAWDRAESPVRRPA